MNFNCTLMQGTAIGKRINNQHTPSWFMAGSSFIAGPQYGYR